MVVSLRVVEDVDARDAEECEIDHSDHSELDWCVPFEEEVL